MRIRSHKRSGKKMAILLFSFPPCYQPELTGGTQIPGRVRTCVLDTTGRKTPSLNLGSNLPRRTQGDKHHPAEVPPEPPTPMR